MSAPDPAALAPLFNAAMHAHRNGDLLAAERGYREVLAAAPAHPPSLNNLGMILQARGALDEAVGLFQHALHAAPDYADAASNLAAALHARGELPAAAQACRRAIRSAPRHPQAHHNLGRILEALGEREQAIAAYRNAVAAAPDNLEAWNNLGLVLQAAGETAGAIDCYRRVVAAAPEAVIVWTNLGSAERAAGALDAAGEAYGEALARQPGEAHALHGLGNVMADRGELDAAMDYYRRALEADPSLADAQHNLGNVLHRRLRIREAIAAWRAALALDPARPDTHSNLLLCLHYVDGVDPLELAAEHRRWGERHAAPFGTPTAAHTNRADPQRRLRVGYLSADFRSHPVGRFIEPVIAAHDRRDFEVHCYSQVPDGDAVTARIRAAADAWCDIHRLDDASVARRIREDGIDLLVDLAGHTGEQRLLVFARKPAPLQITYLGYPDTTGLAAMDYRLSDPIADPPGETERLHSEMLLRLPEGFLLYAPPAEAPDVAPPPIERRGYVTFGSFNNAAKISDTAIELWSRVLAAVPDSRLLLKARPFDSADLASDFRARFAGHGIEASRLELQGWRLAVGDHLAAYAEIDIALDTLPYHGTTTTCEALWMGVPVITLAGRIHAARVGASLLGQVGLGEHVAADAEGYVALARGLAAAPARLAALRSELRDRLARSTLTDGARFIAALESAYRSIWQRWCARDRATTS